MVIVEGDFFSYRDGRKWLPYFLAGFLKMEAEAAGAGAQAAAQPPAQATVQQPEAANGEPAVEPVEEKAAEAGQYILSS